MRSKLHLEHIQEEYKYAIGKGFETLKVRNRDPEAAIKNIPEKKKFLNGSQKELLRLPKRDGKQTK